MEIIISANERILRITQDDNNTLIGSMTKEEFINWLNKVLEIESENES